MWGTVVACIQFYREVLIVGPYNYQLVENILYLIYSAIYSSTWKTACSHPFFLLKCLRVVAYEKTYTEFIFFSKAFISYFTAQPIIIFFSA